MSSNILVVDDDPWILKMVCDVLARRGYSVRAARNGVEALTAVVQFPPDLIVTDLIMPQMDGWTLAENVRARVEWSHIPMLFLSGQDAQHAQEGRRGMRDGDGVLPKPFRMEMLLQAVQTLLERYAFGATGGFMTVGGTPGMAGAPMSPYAPVGTPAGGVPYGQMIPGQMMPGQMVPGQMMPGQMVPGQPPYVMPTPMMGIPGANPSPVPMAAPVGGIPVPVDPSVVGMPPMAMPAPIPQVAQAVPPPQVVQAAPMPMAAPPPPVPAVAKSENSPAPSRLPPPPPSARNTRPPPVPAAAAPPPAPASKPPVPKPSNDGLQGALNYIGLPTLMTMAQLEQSSGIMIFERPEPQETARLFFKRGRVVAARIDNGSLRAHEAVYYLLTWTEGQFSFRRLEVQMDEEIQESTESLILEGARRMDEGLVPVPKKE